MTQGEALERAARLDALAESPLRVQMVVNALGLLDERRVLFVWPRDEAWLIQVSYLGKGSYFVGLPTDRPLVDAVSKAVHPEKDLTSRTIRDVLIRYRKRRNRRKDGAA